MVVHGWKTFEKSATINEAKKMYKNKEKCSQVDQQTKTVWGKRRGKRRKTKNLRRKLEENYYAWNKNSSFEICGMLDFLDNILKRNKPLTKNR